MIGWETEWSTKKIHKHDTVQPEAQTNYERRLMDKPMTGNQETCHGKLSQMSYCVFPKYNILHKLMKQNTPFIYPGQQYSSSHNWFI